MGVQCPPIACREVRPCALGYLGVVGGAYGYDSAVRTFGMCCWRRTRVRWGGFLFEISLFHGFDAGASNESFSIAASPNITSRVVGTVKFKARDTGGSQRLITLENVDHVLQKHKLVTVC